MSFVVRQRRKNFVNHAANSFPIALPVDAGHYAARSRIWQQNEKQCSPSPPREGKTFPASVHGPRSGLAHALWTERNMRGECNRVARFPKTRVAVLPRPGGEGRGEGERNSPGSAAVAGVRAPISHRAFDELHTTCPRPSR